MSNEGETVGTPELADGEADGEHLDVLMMVRRLSKTQVVELLLEARQRLRNCVDALKVLEVDPIALEGDGEDREELLRAAEARGRAMVQHGRQLVLNDNAVREDTIRKALGGALDEEKSLVDTARRVARDLKLAQERTGAAVVDDTAEMVRGRLGQMLHFYSALPESGPTWLHILAAVERWRDVLGFIARDVGLDINLSDSDAIFVHKRLTEMLRSLREGSPVAMRENGNDDAEHPRIDPDDEGVVEVDVTALKRVSDNTVKLTLELVWPEDVQNLTLGRAWLRCNASDDIPL